MNATVTPRVTIITVTFNSERYLRRCIDSVLFQDYPDIEFIIQDGASIDSTLGIVRSYGTAVCKFVSEPDRGAYDAMNRAARRASGELVMFLNSDDYLLEPSSVSFLVSDMLAKGGTWAAGLIIYVRGDDSEFARDAWAPHTWRRMLVSNIIRHPAAIVPLSWIQQFPFNQEFRYAADYSFFLEVWLSYGAPVLSNLHVSAFRLDGTNLSSDYVASLKDEMRARRNFRLAHGMALALVPDYFYYALRRIKLMAKRLPE
jgi:glycosyltransferase involved in cell wall biosynthesis